MIFFVFAIFICNFAVSESLPMHRHFLILHSFVLLAVSTFGQDSLPIVEIKADRTMVYPQRMELTGEETLIDILQMMPDLMISGYEDVITGYNLRIDNCPMNGDVRLILSQMKAKDISKIQVCDNTGVAKGSIGKSRVLDINMVMPDSLKGFVEGQGGFGKDAEGNGTINALYGSKTTDLYANATYRYQNGNKEFLTLHMANRFDDRNKLLTYFTQQYQELSPAATRKVMGRARYFHTFNGQGTELLVVGSYQYASDKSYSHKLPLFNLELNTPLFTDRLSMMLGVEGDYLMTEQKSRDWSWNIHNKDIYLQFTYTLPHWRVTAGHRVMFYGYKIMDEADSQKYTDTRNNTNVSVIYVPNVRNQIHLGYYRKYYNPAYEALFTNSTTLSDADWSIVEGQLQEWDIHQVKLAYAYSSPKFTLQTEASYYMTEGEDNLTEFNTSAYWKSRWLTLASGTNLYIAKDIVFALLRIVPTACFPHAWQIGMQVLYCTKRTPMREEYGTPVYGCLSISKQLGRHWHLGVDWHDMFDALCREAKVNRHAANIKLQYRF